MTDMTGRHAASEPTVGAVYVTPGVQSFLDALATAGGPPIYQLSPADAREVLRAGQAVEVAKPAVDIQDRTVPGGPHDEVSVRIVRPEGFLLVTTHGERYLDRLDDDERARFARGELVVRWAEVPGTNLCTTFHPPSWVRERLVPRGFEEVQFVPEGARGNPYQDLFLLRRAA